MPRRLTDADLAAELQKQGKTVDFKFRPNRKKSISPSESQIQGCVIKWWDASHRSYGIKKNMLLAIPNGGLRDPKIGAQMKREGLRKGASDLFLAVRRDGYAGLFIEMKKPGGVLSEEQKEFLADVAIQGYACRVCFTYDEAVKEIGEYLTE